MDELDPHSQQRALSAFADGELDSAATDRLLRRLADDPAAAESLHRMQQLKAVAGRVVRERTPPVPQSLRERLQAIGSEPSRPSTSWAWWNLIPRAAAAAVLLALGIWIGLRAGRTERTIPAPPGPDLTTAEVIPAAIVSQAEEIHSVCSRLAEGLHSAGYPADVAPLAPSVERDLHSEHPYPDLRPIGYRYRGAGPCGKTLADAAHLLYKSLRPGSINALSVFVQPWHGQYPLAVGRLYTVSVAQSPFPMLAWRTDDVVYFLIADDAKTEQDAVRLIRGAPTSAP